jgi:hypothetical protein
MTDSDLRAKHIERLECSLCASDALSPHTPVYDYHSGTCQADYESWPCSVLALLDRLDKAEAALSVERIATALLDCGLMYRLLEYARTLPTMAHETEETLGNSWAIALRAALLSNVDCACGHSAESHNYRLPGCRELGCSCAALTSTDKETQG